MKGYLVLDNGDFFAGEYIGGAAEAQIGRFLSGICALPVGNSFLAVGSLPEKKRQENLQGALNFITSGEPLSTEERTREREMASPAECVKNEEKSGITKRRRVETVREAAQSWVNKKPLQTGEMVFTTSMTGYQEVLTDPSYAGQIVTFTYPLIGNYGVNPWDSESLHPYVAGVVMGEICSDPHHFQASGDLASWLKRWDIPALHSVDTRALTKEIRKNVGLNGVIVPASLWQPGDDWQVFFREASRYDEVNWVEQVSVCQTVTHAGPGPHIILIDFGSKQSIVHSLQSLGCCVTVVPYRTSFEQVERLNPDGVFLSNGPGNPEVLHPLLPGIKAMAERFPTMGICLGHQLLCMAFGARTKKMAFGHRGANHPVRDVQTGKVFISSQNHGFVVEKESLSGEDWEVRYIHVNDGTVEGVRHRRLPVASVQFHPEAHPGPRETFSLFARFISLLEDGREKHYA